jgi:hypothetical protein
LQSEKLTDIDKKKPLRAAGLELSVSIQAVVSLAGGITNADETSEMSKNAPPSDSSEHSLRCSWQTPWPLHILHPRAG